MLHSSTHTHTRTPVPQSIVLWQCNNLSGDARCGCRLPVTVVCLRAVICWSGDGGVGSRAGRQFISCILRTDRWLLVISASLFSSSDTHSSQTDQPLFCWFHNTSTDHRFQIFFHNPSCFSQFFSHTLFSNFSPLCVLALINSHMYYYLL